MPGTGTFKSYRDDIFTAGEKFDSDGAVLLLLQCCSSENYTKLAPLALVPVVAVSFFFTSYFDNFTAPLLFGVSLFLCAAV